VETRPLIDYALSASRKTGSRQAPEALAAGRRERGTKEARQQLAVLREMAARIPVEH
jgi:hypothetical protein